MMLGQVYQKQENYKGALKVFQEAVDFSPQNSEVRAKCRGGGDQS
jgi:cytochrome c-type biogenesis protein CcmH/NrfG